MRRRPRWPGWASDDAGGADAVANGIQERRQSIRAPVRTPLEFRLERTIRVRVLDLSASGALLWTDDAQPVLAPGRFSMLLGSMCLEGLVRITREEPGDGDGGRRLGAALTRFYPGQEQWLEEFLRRCAT